jgi:TonB-linked SusC/RagA family outer membrane protein
MKKNRRNLIYPPKPGIKKTLLIMKLALIIVLLSVLQVSANVYSQISVSLDVQQKSVRDVLKTIEQQSQVRFFYSDDLMSMNELIDVKANDENILNVLDDIFSKSPLTYKAYENNLIVIAPRELLQQKRITGTVIDKAGTPIVGANIVVTGTTNGTTTDIAGKYSIEVPDGSRSLTFSFIGMVAQEIPIGASTQINVTLIETAVGLDEVVVVGYGTQKRTTVTGAITSVSSKEILAVPVTTADLSLQGRASGVTVVNNGAPGTAATIRIRGLGTMNSNDPLVVIDGVVSNGMANLNPSDIESIEVLKDASTTAIYGSLGSHGVIMISTKKGKSGKMKVDFETYYGQQWNNKRYDLLNVAQYIEYASSPDVTTPPPVITDPQYAGRLHGAETNWQDQIFKKGNMQNYNIAVSSGNENSTSRFSAGYIKTDGIMISTGYERYNIRSNNDYTSGRFKFGQNMGVSFSKTTPLNSSGGRSIIEHAIKSVPYLPVYNPANLGGFQGPHSAVDGTDAENPVAVALQRLFDDKQIDLLGNLYAEVEIISGLKFRSVAGLEEIRFFDNQFLPAFSDDNLPGGATHSNASANITKNRSNFSSRIFTNSLTYTKTIADRHNLELLAVMEYATIDRSYVNTNSLNAISSDIQELTNTSTSLSSASDHYKRIGYLGRLNYNYDQKYIFAASIRRDASSRFGSGNRWGIFPSLALGWRIDKESFMENVSTISNLKLRGSWGKAGNDNIGNYSYASTLTSNMNYVINNVLAPGTTPSGPANADLKWEESTMLNVGLDLGLVKSKFTLSAEYYKNKSSDLLMNLNTSPSLGIFSGSIAKNVGSVETNGFELQLGYNDAEGDFVWSANLNLGTSSNKVLDLGGLTSVDGGPQQENQAITRLEVGKPLFFFYGWKFDGIFTSSEEAAAYLNGGQLAANGGVGAQGGDFRIVDVAGPPDANGKPTGPDGKITSADLTQIGNPFPKFTAGLNFNANYKGFDLNLFFQGSYGNDIYNTNIYDLQGMTRLFNAGTDVMRRWKQDGDVTDVPRPTPSGPNVQISSRFVEDGSYTRLKNLTFGYTLPSRLFGDKVSKFRVYVSGQNLLTITKYKGLDPEVGFYQPGSIGGNFIGSGAATGNGYPAVNFNTGVDYGVYPMPKSFIGGIQITF